MHIRNVIDVLDSPGVVETELLDSHTDSMYICTCTQNCVCADLPTHTVQPCDTVGFQGHTAMSLFLKVLREYGPRACVSATSSR